MLGTWQNYYDFCEEVFRMVATDFALFREKLLTLRTTLLDVTRQMADNALREAKTTRMPNHMAELGTGNFDEELTLGLLVSERAALEHVEAAIARIEDGTYGRCDACGARIAKPRLQAIPYAAHCVRCAAEQEDVLDRRLWRRVLPR
jgi:RNA polymerase-binding protein DksA